MGIRVEITESDLKKIIADAIERKFPGAKIDPDDIKVEVKSKQNYRAEWEAAAFRAVYEKTLPDWER